MKEINKRDSSIELLRIVAIIGVVILHYNSADAGGVFKYIQNRTLNFYAITLTESIFICAVNLFVFVSSFYLSKTNNRRLSKIALLLIQVIAFNIAFYLGFCIFGLETFGIRNFLSKLLPVNYFVILYSALYLVSPYINVVFDKLSKKQAHRFIVILFVLFSIWSFGVDILSLFGNINSMSTIGINGSQEGYTIVNFILLYVLASYISKYNVNIGINKSILCSVICICLIFVMSLIDKIAINYNNPVVIAYAIFIFMIFKNIKIGDSKIINEFSKATFTCFLFHGTFISMLHIEEFANGNTLLLLMHQLLCSISLFLISYIVYKIYNLIINITIAKYIKKLDSMDIFLFNTK